MDVTTLSGSPIDAYVLFKYPEIKDLLKHFLTLISATLVFSVTFSEKIVGYHGTTRAQRALVFGAWSLLVLALVNCGLGLYLSYVTAEAAIDARASGSLSDFQRLERVSYVAQDLAGLFYVLGLVALVASAAHRTAASGGNRNDGKVQV